MTNIAEPRVSGVRIPTAEPRDDVLELPRHRGRELDDCVFLETPKRRDGQEQEEVLRIQSQKGEGGWWKESEGSCEE